MIRESFLTVFQLQMETLSHWHFLPPSYHFYLLSHFALLEVALLHYGNHILTELLFWGGKSKATLSWVKCYIDKCEITFNLNMRNLCLCLCMFY